MIKSERIDKLKLRSFLRQPLTVTVFYVVFIVSFSYVGSKTIWSNYYIWEIPSLALGVASGLGVITLVSAISGVILASSHTKGRLVSWWIAFVRHGNVTKLLFSSSAILLLVAVSLPEKKSSITELLNDLSKKRNDHGLFLDKWKTLNKYKKYNQDSSFLFIKKIYEYRKIKQWKPHEYEEWANYFSLYHQNPNSQVSSWAKMLTADCLDRINQDVKAFAIYKEIATSKLTDDYVRWWSYQELGNYMYFDKKYSEAILSWEKATSFINSAGVNQNIAITYEDLNKFSMADKYYEKALDALNKNMSKNKNVSLGENTSSLYVNWGNMYRLWAKKIADDNLSTKKIYLNKAKNYIIKAQISDPSYLDSYWNMVRLHIELDEYNLARWTIEKAIFVLSNANYYELSRFNYSLLGKKYAAYLSLLIDFYDPIVTTPSVSTLKLSDELIGWDFSREKSLEDFFQAAKESSINLTDENKLLKDSDFVSFINQNTSNKPIKKD